MTCLKNLIDDQFIQTKKFFKVMIFIYFLFYIIPVGILFQNSELNATVDSLEISNRNQTIISYVLLASPLCVLFFFFLFEIVQLKEEGFVYYFTSY